MGDRPLSVLSINRCVTRCAALIAVALTPVYLGCGPEPQVDKSRTTVSGHVTFDGKPLPGGSITFSSPTTGTGTTMMIGGGGYVTNRVPIGQNIVTVETESLQFGNAKDYVRIPAEYSDPSKSGLEVDIKAGVNENVDFALKSDLKK
jgi:hypothetical protein